ncbi:MAG: hypothetical protein NXH74_09415 [Rhodobacteraceae bacterium]|jgi:hypothetical protein|nr:hypothetical protein [Paracoccaceae bacterium]
MHARYPTDPVAKGGSDRRVPNGAHAPDDLRGPAAQPEMRRARAPLACLDG